MPERPHRSAQSLAALRNAARRPGAQADRLARAVRTAANRWHAPAPTTESDRLARLEDDLHEVRTRVNALFFAVFAVGVTDLIGRWFA